MGSCVARPEAQGSEISATTTEPSLQPVPPPQQQRRLSPENAAVPVAADAPVAFAVVRPPEVNDFIVPAASVPSGDSRTSADVFVARRRASKSSEEVVDIGGEITRRDVVRRERENDSTCAARAPPPPAPIYPNTEHTSHASTLTLTEETSHTRPESLAAHAGSHAGDISYDTDTTMLEESARFSSIPLVPRESE